MKHKTVNDPGAPTAKKTSTSRHRMVACALVGLLAASEANARWHPENWDPIKDVTGMNGGNFIQSKIDKTRSAAESIAHNPIKYIAELPGHLASDICSIPTRTYERGLDSQANGHWQALPKELVAILQPHYAGVNLASVRYAQNISTYKGYAATFGNRIYFPGRIDINNPQDLWTMLHELEHTVQYARSSGGEAQFLCEYTAHAFGAGFEHDNMSMEQAADRKADGLIDVVLAAMNNTTNMASVADSASRALQPNEILVVNETDQDVVFLLATPQKGQWPISMQAHSQLVLTAAPGDNQFTIDIQTDDTDLQLLADGGTVQHIDWTDDGVLSAFQSD